MYLHGNLFVIAALFIVVDIVLFLTLVRAWSVSYLYISFVEACVSSNNRIVTSTEKDT